MRLSLFPPRLGPAAALVALAACAPVYGRYDERFTESLTLTELRDARVFARFEFESELLGATPRDPVTLGLDDESQHYTVFPLALGQILREHAIAELHLSLNAGQWNYDEWGLPEGLGTVGAGGELWAWMADGTVSVDQRWSDLRQSLSGLFCATLSSLDASRTSSPISIFPSGPLPASTNASSSYHLRHGILPGEGVCTENLTPFAALLPCARKSGLGSLLEPHRLFDADWHGMGVHVTWDPALGVRVKMTFGAVFNPVRTSGDGRRDWSLTTLFGRGVERSCPAAASSVVKVLLAANSTIVPPFSSVSSDGYASYDLVTASKPVDISLRWTQEASFERSPIPGVPLAPLSIDRTLQGDSQIDGHLHVSIRNNDLTQTREVLYAETLPPLVTLYLHTLQVHIDGQRSDDAFTLLRYEATDRRRPTLLQARLAIPAGAVLTLSVVAEKAFLAYAEHRPDAQRGWDLPGAVFVPLPLEDGAGTGPDARRAYMRTRTLLLELATPDFSMPYNVIIMTGTLIALVFGSVFNMVTRTFVVIPMDATPGVSQDATAGPDAAKVAMVVGADEPTQVDAYKQGVQG